MALKCYKNTVSHNFLCQNLKQHLDMWYIGHSTNQAPTPSFYLPVPSVIIVGLVVGTVSGFIGTIIIIMIIAINHWYK